MLLLGEVRRLVPHEVVHQPLDPEASDADEEAAPQEEEESLGIPSQVEASSELPSSASEHFPKQRSPLEVAATGEEEDPVEASWGPPAPGATEDTLRP